MQIALSPTSHTQNTCDSMESTPNTSEPKSLASARSLVGVDSFLPIQLFDSSVSRLSCPQILGRRVDWIVVDDGNGGIQFRTTQGHLVVAAEDGKLMTLSSEDTQGRDERTDSGVVLPGYYDTFSICRVPETAIVSDYESSDDEDLELVNEERRKVLWMLKTPHGSFLAADSVKHTLSCTKAPSFWQVNDNNLSLTCTKDTPPRRLHYRNSWKKQNVAYVMAMRERYLNFSLKCMGVWEALTMAKFLPCHPFRVGGIESGGSLRTFCFRAAEAVRIAGFPDWMQIVALVHELGRVVSCINVATTSIAEDNYDWTLSCRSRVVGCRAPGRASFREFRYLNSDEVDERLKTPQGMYEMHCGLDNAMLMWTGPEYVYHMLMHNNVLLPKEALSMIRYFSLGDWHSHCEYDHLMKAEDEEIKIFVSDFDKVRRKSRGEESVDFTDAECHRLWMNYYENILEKYDCLGNLWW